MSHWRRAPRDHRDSNEPEIVEALEVRGWTVLRLHVPKAKGVPDLLVGKGGRTELLEVKHPIGPRGGSQHLSQKLNDDQKAWHAWWRGSPVHVVRSPQEALRAVGEPTE